MANKKTAHAQLDELRQHAGAERVKARDLDMQKDLARAEAEAATRAVTDAYSIDDTRAITAARKTEDKATANLDELEHRTAAATVRVERAQHELDQFQVDHAHDLLGEREEAARTVAAELTASVHSTLRLAKAYIAERQAQDQLVAQVPNATPRTDGPPATHAWEAALKTLERAVADTPELAPPLPRWLGVQHHTTQDLSARRLKLQRKRKLSTEQEQELDRINQQLGVTAPIVEVA